MALPFNDPSQFIEYSGPNGPIAIPQQFAGNFQLPPPPPGPLPTFDPTELAPPPPMPPDPAGPVPSAFAPPPPPQQPQFVNPDEAAALPAMPAPRPQRQAPLPPAPPPSPLDDRNAALAVEADAIRQRGDAIGAAANEEARLYGEADKRAAAMETARAAEREKEIKERDRARADVNAATDRYVNYKVDENRRWNDLSTGRKILAGIAVALSGLGNALANKGSAPNGALEMIKGAIQDDLRLQMDERDQLGKNVSQKKDTFADLRQTLSDNESVYKAAVAGEYERAANQIRTAAASSKGDIAKSESEIAVSHLMGEAGKLRQEAADTDYSRKMAEKNYRLAASGQSLQNKKFERDKFESDRQFGEGARRFDAELDLKTDALAKEAAAARAVGDTKAAEAADKKSKELRQEAVFSPKGEVLTQKDGTPWMTGDAVRATKMRDQVSNVSKMTAMADKIIALRNKHGWSSDFAKSSEFQEMKQVFADMQLTEKDVRALGAISGPDFMLISNVLGSEDPTSLRDPTPALKSYREGAVRNLNKHLTGQGYDGDPISFPDIRDTDPGLAAYDDPEVQSVLQYDESKRSVLGGRSSALPNTDAWSRSMSFSPVPEPGKLNQLADRGKSMFAGYTQKQENALLSFADRAADGEEAGRARLKAAAEDSHVPEIRAIAAELLKQVDSGSYESRPSQVRGAISKVRAALGAPVKE